MSSENTTHTEAPSGSAPTTTTVAVVGAGLAGLTAARALHRAGVDVLVLEAADRLGGRAMSETTALGSRVDLGGQWIGHDHHRVAALATELGATQFRMNTTLLPTILDGARRVRLGAPSILATGGLLLGLEALSHIRPRRRWDTTTVADWLAKVPGRTPRRLLELAALISWTADLDRMSVQTMMKLIRVQGGLRTMLTTTGGAQEDLLVEGVGTLVDGVAGELGPRVRLGHRVTSIAEGAGTRKPGISTTTSAAPTSQFPNRAPPTRSCRCRSRRRATSIGPVPKPRSITRATSTVPSNPAPAQPTRSSTNSRSETSSRRDNETQHGKRDFRGRGCSLTV